MDFMKNLGNMGEMMKKATQMKGEFDRIKFEAEQEVNEIKQQGVEISFNGLGEVSSVRIDPELLSQARGAELEETVKSVFNQASDHIKNNVKHKFSGLAGGMF